MGAQELKFKTGNICRIYIKNFLTFKEVEVRPKPKLNIICGPNGSGKSTVLCAICLCLGGKAAVMGRGKEVYEYVKMGESEATLEVEVYVEDKVNVVIQHKINKAARKCTWYLQGRETSHKEAMRRIQELSIYVDNLCQFLPQDRVVSFAKMNCQELLVATEKGIGDPSLYQEHSMLCDSGKRLATLQERTKELQLELAQAERKNARLKDVVDNLEVKQKLETELKELRIQRIWYLYDYKRKIHQEHKEAFTKTEDELKSLKNRMEPTMEKIRQRNSSLSQMRKIAKEKTEFIRKSEQTSQRLKSDYENFGDGMKDAVWTYNNQLTMEEQRKNELFDYKRQLDVLMGKLQNLPEIDEEETTHRLRELTDKIHKSSQRIVGLQGQTSDITTDKTRKAATISGHIKELTSLQDMTGQRVELLRLHHKDAYRATQWLKINKDSFKGLVYPPICALLNIKNQRYARYIEDGIMERDLVAFVCEDKDDVNRLKEEMDRQRCCVNIVYANPDILDRFRPQRTIDELRKFGFETYMKDCMDAPRAILSFLCQNYNIHAVPIGASGDYDRVPHSVNVFYLGNSKYSRTISRYDGQVSTSIFPLGPCKLLSFVQDNERIAMLQNKIKQLQQEIKEDEETLRGIEGEERELTKSLDSWRNEKRMLSNRIEERKVLDQRITHKRNQIKKHEEEAMDVEALKRTRDQTIKQCIKDQIHVLVKQQTMSQEMSVGVCECLRAEGRARVVSSDVMALEDSLRECKGRVMEMEKTVDVMARELEKQKLEGRDALAELKQMLGIVSIKEITAEIRSRFQNSSLEETEQLLAEKDAHLSCLTTASTSELREYRDGQKELTRLKDSLQDVQRTLETHFHDLTGVKERWHPRITQLVSDISAKFSEFMAQMGYAGEVALEEKGEDFDSYGMVVRVKFRDEQRLQRLTAQQQSGGERAVSTALYLLALQSLTAAPFRCVDEINQGMDKVNERKMLEMMMVTLGTEDCSQYFFVTPKLLQHIEYSQKVNVMVIFNSSTTLSHRRLNIKRILKRKEEADRRRGGESSQGV